MGQLRAEEFDRFVAARWSTLLHLARLLTGGDRHRAEDLLQEALVKLWFAWPRVAEQAPEAYVRKVLARAAARSARRRWWGEQPVEKLPDPPGVGDEIAAVDERTRLEATLALLPARQRAAVVLRYYQDLPEQQVAEVLGCPVGTARSLTARGVARLRQLLSDKAATADPVEAVKAEPVEAVKPVGPVAAAEPVGTDMRVEPAKPVEAVKPVETAKPVEAVKPDEPAKPVEAVKTVEPLG